MKISTNVSRSTNRLNPYNVNTAYTIATSDGIGSQEQFHRIGNNLLVTTLSVFNLDRDTLLEVNDKVLRCVGGLEGVLCQFPHVTGRSSVGVFQDTSLIGAVSQVLVHTPWLGLGRCNGNALVGSVGEQVVTALEAIVENRVTPWGNHLDVGLQGVECKFETDLVVTLASTAVGNGKTSLFLLGEYIGQQLNKPQSR